MKTGLVRILLVGTILGVGTYTPTIAAVYVDPNNEFVVADTADDESKPRISGSNVTWSSKPPLGKDDVYYRTLPADAPINITNDPVHTQYYSDISGNIIVYNDVNPTGVKAYTIGGGTVIVSEEGSRKLIAKVCVKGVK